MNDQWGLLWAKMSFNSLLTRWCGSDFKRVNFKHNMETDILSIQVHIVLKWIPEDLVDNKPTSWWRHQMETFPTLLALCAGNSPVTG